MKKKQEFQQKMGRVQEELAAKEVTSSVGGGMVSVTVNGRHELLGRVAEVERTEGDITVSVDVKSHFDLRNSTRCWGNTS